VKQELIAASLAPSTRDSYLKTWTRFQNFASQTLKTSHPPYTSDHIASYVAFLHTQKYAPATICSHLSAISYFHTLANFSDPCDNVIIRRMTLGCKKISKHNDSRLPFLSSHIHKLIIANEQLHANSPYLQALYKAIILLAFFGFFRMGEILPQKSSSSSHVLQIDNISLQPKHIHVQLLHYKTQKTDKPLNIHIPAQKPHCPLHALSNYINFRGRCPGPLFISSVNDPITLSMFRNVLRNLVIMCDLTPSRFTMHSFRIGACTQAVMAGVPQDKIMLMGRWRSNAYKRYIRVPDISL